MDPIRVRPAGPDDSRDIWTWRNDPDTRSNSVRTEAVAWEAHEKWFATSLSDPRKRFFVGLTADDRKVGMCRFDSSDDGTTSTVSINLNPEMRGRRLSAPFLGAAIAAFRGAGFSGARIDAVVKTGNVASVKCFEANGFTIGKTEGGLRHYSLAPSKGKI